MVNRGYRAAGAGPHTTAPTVRLSTTLGKALEPLRVECSNESNSPTSRDAEGQRPTRFRTKPSRRCPEWVNVGTSSVGIPSLTAAPSCDARSPTINVRPGLEPNASSAARKMAGSGFCTPHSNDSTYRSTKRSRSAATNAGLRSKWMSLPPSWRPALGPAGPGPRRPTLRRPGWSPRCRASRRPRHRVRSRRPGVADQVDHDAAIADDGLVVAAEADLLQHSE